MSYKAKRKKYRESFFIERWLRKLYQTKLSTPVITVILAAYAIFLFGGGVYTIVSPDLPPYTGSGFLFIHPELDAQFVSETIIMPSLFIIGFAGVLFLYHSTKYAYKPRQAYMTAIIGVSLLFIAYIFLEGIFLIKIS